MGQTSNDVLMPLNDSCSLGLGLLHLGLTDRDCSVLKDIGSICKRSLRFRLPLKLSANVR